MKELVTVEKGYINGLLRKENQLQQVEAKYLDLQSKYRELEHRLYLRISADSATHLMELGNYDESVNPVE